MEATTPQKTVPTGKRRVKVMAVMGCLLAALLAGFWLLRTPAPAVDHLQTETSAIPVVMAAVAQRHVPVKFKVKGSVTSLQAVEVRSRITATIKTVHIKEGQFVSKGERLFTLDTRAEEANLAKAIAQLAKTRVELKNAERQLDRQRELFYKNFISQAALDVAENQVDVLRNQLQFDQAAVEADRVARNYGEIVAPISGRTGAIQVYPGSLVRPEATMLVSITQIDPIHVSFVLPERELAPLKQAFAKEGVTITAQLDLPGMQAREGRIVFIDSAVDTASGTIRIKAEFANADGKFWPGMFANVTLVSSTLPDVLTVPAQALQTGPRGQFVFVVGKDHKTDPHPVTVRLIQDGIAVVEGLTQGECVVIEGMQNLRPGSMVRESRSDDISAQSACGQQFLSDQAQWIPDSGVGMFSPLNAISAPI